MGEQLLSLRQGNQSAVEFALTFHTLAGGSGWNEPVLKAAYHQDLNQDILMELAYRDDQASLNSLVDLSIHFDHLLKYQG